MAFSDDFIYNIGITGKQWGIGEPAGKVWGVLLFNKNPLTQKEIARQSRYSPGLVSRSITLLENLGMVSNIGKKDKEKLYTATASTLDFFGRLMVNQLEKNIKPIISLLEDNINKVDNKDTHTRMIHLIKDYSTIRSMLEVLSETLTKKEYSKILAINKK